MFQQSIIKSISISIIAFLSFQAQSQNIDSLFLAVQNAGLSNYQFKTELGLLSTSVSFEKRINQKLSLFNQVSFNLHGYQRGFVTQLIYGEEYVYLFIPKTHVGLRYYRNLGRRVAKGKNISNNSGNYLALNSEVYTSFFNLSNIGHNLGHHSINLVPAYGLQRTFLKRFTFDMWTGIGILMDTNLEQFFIVRLDMRVGYIWKNRL